MGLEGGGYINEKGGLSIEEVRVLGMDHYFFDKGRGGGGWAISKKNSCTEKN